MSKRKPQSRRRATVFPPTYPHQVECLILASGAAALGLLHLLRALKEQQSSEWSNYDRRCKRAVAAFRKHTAGRASAVAARWRNSNWKECDDLLIEIFIRQTEIGLERSEEIFLAVRLEIEQFRGRKLRMKHRPRILPRLAALFRRLRLEINAINQADNPPTDFFQRLSRAIRERLNGKI